MQRQETTMGYSIQACQVTDNNTNNENSIQEAELETERPGQSFTNSSSNNSPLSPSSSNTPQIPGLCPDPGLLDLNRKTFLEPHEGWQMDSIEMRLCQGFTFHPFTSSFSLSSLSQNDSKQAERSASVSHDKEDSSGICLHKPSHQSSPDSTHNSPQSSIIAGKGITAPNTSPHLGHMERFTPLSPLPEIEHTSFEDVLNEFSRCAVEDQQNNDSDYNDEGNSSVNDDDTASLLKVSLAGIMPPVISSPS